MADSSVTCGKCGTETFEGAHFCTVCGSHLSAVAAAPDKAQRRAIDTKLFDLNLADIDQSFDALIDPGGAAAQAPILDERRESFRLMAQAHLRPIREFMIGLEIGDTTPEDLAACLAAIDRLGAAAFTVGVEAEVAPALGELAGAFQRLGSMPAGARPSEEVVILRRAYEALIEQLRGDTRISGGPAARLNDPESESLDEAEGKREHTMDNQSPKEKRTIVEEGTLFKGTLSSSCPVDVRGRVDGEIETPALTVSATGAVHGQAKVGSVRSEGELSGEFEADTVKLSGVVRDNTVIRARELDVKLASERGKLQVIFGEAEHPVAEMRDPAGHEPTPMHLADHGAGALPSEPNGDQAFRAESGSTAGDDGGNWQRGGRRRPRGNRHSEPPPAVG